MMFKKNTSLAMMAAAALLAGQASAGTFSTAEEWNGAEPLPAAHTFDSEGSSQAAAPAESYSEATSPYAALDTLPDHLTVFHPDGSVHHFQFVAVDLMMPQDGYHATAEFGHTLVLGPEGAYFMVVEVADPLIVFVDDNNVQLGSIVWLEADDSGDSLLLADAGDMQIATAENPAQEDAVVIG